MEFRERGNLRSREQGNAMNAESLDLYSEWVHKVVQLAATR